jgi:hypothetical protein
MGLYNKIGNMFSSIEESENTGNIISCAFDLIMISRSLIYDKIYRDFSGNFIQFDEHSPIDLVDEFRKHDDNQNLFFELKENDMFFSQKSKQQKRTRLETFLKLFSIFYIIQNKLLSRIGNGFFQDELNKSIDVLFGIFSSFYPEINYDNDYVTDFPNAHNQAVVISTSFFKLHRCEGLIVKQYKRLKTKQKHSEASVLKKTYKLLKTSDRISTTKSVIRSSERSLKKISSNKKTFGIFKIFKKALNFIKTKLLFSGIKKTAMSFFKLSPRSNLSIDIHSFGLEQKLSHSCQK